MWKDQPYFHSYFLSHCGEKKGKNLRGKNTIFQKCREFLSCNLNVQLINFEFSGSQALSWGDTFFPLCLWVQHDASGPNVDSGTRDQKGD